MSILAKITNPPKPKNIYSVVVATTLAAIFVLMSLWHLYSLDDFLSMVAGYNLPGGYELASFLGCYLIILEVFSVPFLLRMNLSLVMRYCSMFSSWLFAVTWLFLDIWLITNGMYQDNFDGYVVAAWMSIPYLIIVMLVVISSWGLWPGRKYYR